MIWLPLRHVKALFTHAEREPFKWEHCFKLQVLPRIMMFRFDINFIMCVSKPISTGIVSAPTIPIKGGPIGVGE